MRGNPNRRGQLSAALFCAVVGVLAGRVAYSQSAETDGLQAAAAIESALVNSIAKAEKSVVAIAQYRQYKDNTGPKVLRRDPFAPGLQRVPGVQPLPQDADFVPTEYGAGIIIDRRGLILTNFHVLGRDTAEYEVKHYVTTVDRKTREAVVKAADPRSDLAVLEIQASDLEPITLGNAATLRKGQLVVALGNPYAIARDGQVSASHGIISNLARKAGAAPVIDEAKADKTRPTLHHFGTLIQTDAKLNLGTSGGALINLRGELIGLTTSAAAASGYEQSAGYAIPVDDLFRRVLNTLKEGKEVEYGFMGVRPQRSDELSTDARSGGMRVDSVVAGTAAARAGVQANDLIVRVNETAVQDADHFFLLVGRMPAEAKVNLVVLRNDRRQAIPVTLTKFPVSPLSISTAAGTPAWRGLRVDYVTALANFAELHRLGRIPEIPCVVVTHVEPDSLAAAAGITQGMFITHLDDTKVETPKDFATEARRAAGSTIVRMLNEEKTADPLGVRYDFRPKTKTLPAKAP